MYAIVMGLGLFAILCIAPHACSAHSMDHNISDYTLDFHSLKRT